MAQLSDIQLERLKRVAERTPDAVLGQLVRAWPTTGEAAAAARDVLARQLLEREARSLVFEPLRPFLQPPRNAAARTLPAGASAFLWALARDLHPELCECVIDGVSRPDPTAAVLGAADDICCELAAALRAGLGGEAPQDAHADLGDVAAAALLLSLAPLIRAAKPKLETWAHHLTSQSSAQVRAVFAEAARLDDEAGPLFIEALGGLLTEPRHVLRLISLILDRPTDQFLATSPLARVVEGLLIDIERGVERARGFKPGESPLQGGEAGAAVQTAALTLLEFEQWVDVGRSGPWGPRLAAARRGLAMAVEAHLRATARIIADALPTRAARWGAKVAHGAPRVGRDPEERHVVRAVDQAAFLAAVRGCPSSCGFAALRAKVSEALDLQLDDYIEDLLDMAHRGPKEDRPRVQAFLEAAARVTDRLAGEGAGRIVRRRAAAA